MDNNINNATIYNWFDKCGIISNIRTQLRQNLVQALKCKEMTINQPHPRSAKQYVHDLLIAEYLLKTNFMYTLSVFSSEAPLPAHFDQLLTANDSKTEDKLQNDYLQHTLETIGINYQNPIAQLVLSEYTKGNEPLLICILHCLKFCLLQNNKKGDKSSINKNNSIKDESTQTADANFCDKCINLIQIKKKLVHQKEEFDKVLHEKSEKLRNQAKIAEQQFLLLQEKMEQTQNLMQSLNTKRKEFTEKKRQDEEDIHKKKLELLHKEEFLIKETNRLEMERNSYKQFEENLQRLQNELIKIKKGLSDGEMKTNNEIKSIQVQTDFKSFTTNDNEKKLLQREIQDLKSLIHEQQERIKQLTHRVVQLSRQLEELQILKINHIQASSRIPYTSTFISEGSSTDDILQDAKTRLKRLEEESLLAEKRYHNYMGTGVFDSIRVD